MNSPPSPRKKVKKVYHLAKAFVSRDNPAISSCLYTLDTDMGNAALAEDKAQGACAVYSRPHCKQAVESAFKAKSVSG